MLRHCILQTTAVAFFMASTIFSHAQVLPQAEAFSSAVEQGNVAQVRAFLKQEPRLATSRTSDGWPTFLQQAMFFEPEILHLLLANGANPNVRNDRGEALLHLLADPASIRALLAAGADIEARDQRGWTPLMSHATDAATGPDAVYTLLAEGADPQAKGLKGETAASLLPQGERFDAIRQAIRSKALQRRR